MLHGVVCFFFYFLTLNQFVCENLGRSSMHPISQRVLTRCAAQLGIKCMSWPQGWGVVNPRSHIEWFMELNFAFRRKHHATGNFDFRDYAFQSIKQTAAQVKAMSSNNFKRRNSSLPKDADERIDFDRVAIQALNTSVRLMVLCCPGVYEATMQGCEELRTYFLHWCGSPAYAHAMLCSPSSSAARDVVDALHEDGNEDGAIEAAGSTHMYVFQRVCARVRARVCVCVRVRV